MLDLCRSESFQQLLQDLRSDPPSEGVSDWPGRSLLRITDAGGMRWNIPRDFGGDGLSSAEMLEVYRELSSACLASTFILTQRNAACARIASSANQPLRESLLSRLAKADIFSTVGISHLTTSRQHLARPAVTVEPRDGEREFVLNGSVPWVTSGSQADVLVTGGTLADARQILAAVPLDRPGVELSQPVELMALSCTQTGGVTLKDVTISADEVLHGPVEKVMSSGSGGGAGSLGTSSVAIGAAQGTLLKFQLEAERRPGLQPFLDPLLAEADDLVEKLRRAGDDELNNSGTEQLRQRANSLVIRSAQAWLAATKGAGFVSGHPAERAVRESMFFLVWSCPQPVLEANLRELTCFGTP